VLENEKESMIIFELVNIACFSSKYSKELDGNFITIYNKDKDDYDYFIERLVGIKIENDKDPYKGKIWVPYINNQKEDWSFLCQKNRIVTKQDEIVFKYEVFVQDDAPPN
jgi:hypothetical protein